MERFNIEVKINGRLRSLPVEMTRDKDFETYQVTGNKNTLVLRCNLPMLRARGLKNKRADWKLLEGLIHNSAVLEAIQAALEARSRGI
jgi:hypothetical protein